jgi:serine O-acetyltransferase
VAVEREIPSGFRGIRADFAHFAKVQGAESFGAKLWLLCASRAFWGLAIYRYGRWVYGRKSSVFFRALYTLWFEIGRRLTKTSLSVRSRIEGEVWLAPQGEIFCSMGSRIGFGSMLFGQNTLGVGGRPGARGHPQIGERVVLLPGASAVGPVTIADGAVMGANSLAGRSIASAGDFIGVPAKVSKTPIQVPQPQRPPRSHTNEEQEMEPFWPAFRADLERYYVYFNNPGTLTKLRLALITDSSWSMALYRFGRSLKTVPRFRYWRAFLWAVYRVWELCLGLLTSVSIDVDAEIAPGFYLGHFVSVRIGRGVKIGKNCSVGQMCTIEANARGEAPVIGERVYFGSGAKVIGGFKIGDGAAICASSVVTQDVPENGVVMGNPGLVISKKGSGDFIYLGEGTGVRDAIPEQPPVRAAV